MTGFLLCSCQTAFSFMRPFVRNITSLHRINRKQFSMEILVVTSPKILMKTKFANNVISLSKFSAFNAASRNSEPVVLFSYNNTKFLKIVNLFGLTFAGFWFFTAYQFGTMRISPAPKHSERLPWYANFDLLSSPIKKTVATVLAAGVGCAVLGGAWMYSIRCVGKLTLNKGGKSVSINTFQPLTLSMNRTINVNVNEVSCLGHRSNNTTVPLKVKGQRMHFLLMNEGVYHNVSLFDKTVGLSRCF